MSTSHQKQTGKTWARIVSAALAASLLGACTAKKEDGSDAGSTKLDGSVRDASVPRDGAVKEDGGGNALDGSVAADSSVATDGGKLDGSAAPPDAGIIDPITAGTDNPTLSKVGYFNDELGQRVLIPGRDPNGDIASYTIKFFHDATPVGFNIDNDTDTPDITEFTNTLPAVPNEAGFFIIVNQTEEFVAAVNNVKITVTDTGGRKSEELSAAIGPVPTVSTSCDPYGFNRCSGTNVCSKAGMTYSCKSVSTARTSACAAALTLAPPGVTSVSGRVQPPSLWDPPSGCTTGELQPDRVVKLKLTADAAKVVLSTNNVNTNFDTVIYQLSSCTTQPASCVDENCPCSDDILATGDMPRVPRSRLELRNVAKGEYLFVVDSRPTSGGAGDWFELTVTLE